MDGTVITLGGPPGSGKSTAAKTLAATLERELHSAGEIFRAEAARRELTLADFGALAAKDERIDLALDERMVTLAKPGALLEGRIIGQLLANRRIPVFRILVTAGEATRARRIAGRDGGSFEDALQALRARERVERDRYLRYYGIDLATLPNDWVVDSSLLDPAGVVKALLAGLPPSLKPVGEP